jgi:hypothetical protein
MSGAPMTDMTTPGWCGDIAETLTDNPYRLQTDTAEHTTIHRLLLLEDSPGEQREASRRRQGHSMQYHE